MMEDGGLLMGWEQREGLELQRRVSDLMTIRSLRCCAAAKHLLLRWLPGGAEGAGAGAGAYVVLTTEYGVPCELVPVTS